jgi:ribulose-phosphate 3-epimerase
MMRTIEFEAGKTLVSPSILSADFSALGNALEILGQACSDWIHVDVMDGLFVPNLTIGPPIIKALRAHSTLPFDVHLMIEKPERYLEDFRNAGADVITVHQEACTHLHRTLAEIRRLGAKAGVSLNPGTSPETLRYVLDEVDLILVMSVNPGFGGQKFIPSTLEKLKAVKAMVADRPIFIEVDGGITPDNAHIVREAGANVLVSGSAVFKADNMSDAIKRIRG